MDERWLVLGAIALLYAVVVAVWRWLVRRWGLAGPGAPPRTALSEREYLARRSLRALLAFDFLLIIPVGVVACVAIAVAATEPDGVPPEMIFLPLAFLAFLLPIPALRRSLRHMEQQRRAGVLVEPAPAPNSSGLPALDAHLGRKAWGTLVAAGLIVLGSLAAWAVPEGRLAELLLKDNDAVRAGQVWRLLTVALVHGSVLHLFFNVFILVSAGSLLERLAGAPRQLAVLGAGTVAGSMLSVALVDQPSVGASGGVLAIAAAVVAFGQRHRSLFPPAARARLFRASVELVALNVVLTFVLPRVDWAGHVGGLLCGAVLGWFAKPTRETLAALAAGAAQQLGPPPPDAAAPER